MSSASAAASRGEDAGSDAQAGSAMPVRTSQRQAAKHVATLPSVEVVFAQMVVAVDPLVTDNSGDGSRRSVIMMIARAAHARADKVAKSQHRREVYELRVRQAAHAR
ncbi:hypothetical protein F441_06350 [Phytophthora nicotianae CJ01A1]|uniref:Uncharacterized protein n=2 Tax=Phytophthora nicotianae TaxID=4792 RepID=W2ZL69_PHYNI|nr:hypothetical protein F441_06350 [Phytophthora nicotianae CJ01A1]ETP47711.1 hypothetical protein F442_06387 [Phytophthora nicotianae P10297]